MTGHFPFPLIQYSICSLQPILVKVVGNSSNTGVLPGPRPDGGYGVPDVARGEGRVALIVEVVVGVRRRASGRRVPGCGRGRHGVLPR